MTHPHEGLQERALKPCPFCGGDELSHGYTMAGGQMIGNAECHTCGVYIVAEDEASAIENWNTCADPLTGTPPVPQDQGLRDALEKKLIEAQAIVSCMAHRPSCVLGDDMCLCGLSQLDRVLRLPAETDEGEELPYQSDDWKLRGYPSAAAEIEDMANVGRALMHAIEKDYAADPFMKGWHPADCPTEIVGDLLNALAEASTPTSQPPAAETRLRRALAPFAAIKMGDDADCLTEIVPNGYSDPSDWRRHIKRAREALSPPQQAATDEGVGQ